MTSGPTEFRIAVLEEKVRRLETQARAQEMIRTLEMATGLTVGVLAVGYVLWNSVGGFW